MAKLYKTLSADYYERKVFQVTQYSFFKIAILYLKAVQGIMLT